MAWSAPKERALPGIEGKTNIGTSNAMGKMPIILKLAILANEGISTNIQSETPPDKVNVPLQLGGRCGQ